eukprot:1809541-Rhodomonas_salina.1
MVDALPYYRYQLRNRLRDNPYGPMSFKKEYHCPGQSQGCQVAISLRVCYAMPGTGVAHCITCLCASDAKSGSSADEQSRGDGVQ